MKSKVLAGFFLLITLALGTGFPKPAYAQSKSMPQAALPLENAEDPVVDLLYQGRPLDPDTAVDLKRRGLDLATLDPRPADVWSDRVLSFTDEESATFPIDGATVDMHRIIPDNPSGHFRAQVSHEGRMFRLRASLSSHAALARAALLRRLGYPVQTPKHYNRLTITFPDKDERDNFISELKVQAGGIDPERFVTDMTRDTQIVVQDVLLESPQIIVPTSFYVGNLNATHVKGQRIVRALLIPFVLLDIPENPNLYSSEAGQLVNENVVLTHAYADAFEETTFDDARWIMKRIARLSREDIRLIVEAGRYPPDITAILVEKTVARRNNLMALFKMQSLTTEPMGLPYSLNVNVGWVVDGKITKEKYDGYAQRFTHGDPKSPITRDEIFRFLKIEVMTAALKALTFNINKELELFRMDSLLEKRAEGLRNQFNEFRRQNPTKPYSQPISTWHGPTGGLSLNASRNIVTGSYYGQQSSDFKVHLVDQITTGARIGYFMGVDGVPKVMPGISGNMSVQRSYVHVRPVPSIEAGSKKEWADLWVPGFMKHLAEALETDAGDKSGAENLQKLESAVEKFLDDLKDHETFTITDSISFNANASVVLPITLLLGMDPVGFNNSFVIGANGSIAWLRRTTFTREGGKIKIYLNGINTRSLGATFDFNWWMNILSLSYTHKWGSADTLAFHLDEKPSDEAVLRHTVSAVRSVLRNNSAEPLKAEFFPYKLDHATDAKIRKGKFLFFRWSNLTEEHRVKVQPPRDPKRDFDPAQHERTLYSFKVMNRTGNNYQSFLSDVIDGVVQKSTSLPSGLFDFTGGANPADSFMGSAKWRIVTTEAEVTVGRESPPVTVSEHYWAGWQLKKDKVFKVIDGIDQRVASMNIGLPLVDRGAFHDMKSLQLYEIRTTFIVYDEAMKRLRDRLLVKNGDPGTFFNRAFGWNEFSGTDKELVLKVLIPLYGEARWEQWCNEHDNTIRDDTTRHSPSIGKGQFLEHGRSYTCMADWVRQVLSLRRQYPVNDREAQVRWATKIINVLEQNVDLGNLIRWLGTDHTFFQIKISGFRTKDENGDLSDYKSSTIGTFNTKSRGGIFKDFASDYQITSHELNAAYLSEGF